MTDTTPVDNGYCQTATSPPNASSSSQRNTSPMLGMSRRPQAPSPLSQVTAGTSSDQHTKKKVHISPDVQDDTAPCFIHSGLDKHGSLQDWLRGKSHHHVAGPHRRRSETSALNGSAAAQLEVPRPSARRLGRPQPMTPAFPTLPNSDNGKTSPPDLGGYDSDKSSTLTSPADSSAIQEDDDEDEEDEDEATSSLTRQLAATAQGVREVSKELGRTRVHSRIQTVLIVTKARDNRLIGLTRELALYLMQKGPPSFPASAANSTTDLRNSSRSASTRGMIVYVDAQLKTSKRFDAEGLQRDHPDLFEPITRRRSSSMNASMSASTTSINTMASGYSEYSSRRARGEEGQLRYWTAEMCSNSPQLFDFVVTLGGDGTVLFTSWLFQKIVPPVLPFALGSLGFLTNFNFAGHRKTMDRVIDEGIRVNLRMRFTCTVYRAVAPDEDLVVKRGHKRKAIRRPGGEILVRQVDKDGWEALEGRAPMDAVDSTTSGKDKEIMCFSTRPVEQFEVLNDLVVDRGPSPFVSLLEVFGDDHHLTTVQADGLTVSTPTGSTAYSLSAGGSLVHPQIPALLLTPICPHTLSFRPMLLPDSMEVRVCVPYNSRSTAWASFDGRGRVELKQGDHIKITASKYPFPTVCADKQSSDWFRSISRTLRWNERERQKSFVVVEEDREPRKTPHANGGGSSISGSDDEYYTGSSEEDEFDIDDKSGGDVTPNSPQGLAPVGPVNPRMRNLATDMNSTKSGVQSPNRFASGYQAPPPLSQRHLLEALASVEKDLAKVELQSREHTEHAAEHADEMNDEVTPLPESEFTRVESDATLAPPGDYGRHSRRDSEITLGGRTPRQGRSRSRSRARENSRSGSPSVKPRKPKAFAFFGQDDSTSELSD